MEEMLHKQIIRETGHETTEFFSRIFIVKMPDGGTTLILNLKELNEFVKYEHFKMDCIKTIINMVTRNCFMATIDRFERFERCLLECSYKQIISEILLI